LKKKILYFTNIFPHYRLAIWKGLLNSKIFDLEIYFSQKNPLGIHSPELKDIFTSNERSKLHLIKNYWIKKKVLIWQSKIIKTAFFSEFDYLLLLGEMNVISSWISIFIAKLRGKKVFLWSHGIYGNESFIKKTIRLTFLKQADFIFLYENRSKLLLKQNGFSEDSLEVVYNSLDYDLHNKIYLQLKNTKRSDIITYFSDNSLPVIIFIGRLTANKKINLLIDALKNINNQKTSYNLLIVGEGEKLDFLKNAYQNSINDGWLYFYGSSYESSITSQLIYHSDLCVSPGNIGLTAIHSLSFGTPVASHNNFINQMPEVEAIIDGENGFLFQENDTIDMANKIVLWFSNNPKVNKEIVRKIITEKYNPDNQLSIFKKHFSNG
jgi:glycosyltransferase involved in cell wall biosynthesis